MDLIPPIPADGEKRAGIVGKALFGLGEEGLKQLSPRKMKALREVVTESGWAVPQGKSGHLRSFAIGPKGMLKTMKGRYQQGGALGKGGLIRGDLAFNPELFKKIQRIRGGTATWKDYPGVAGHLAGTGVNAAMSVGMPAVMAYSAATAPLLEGESRMGNALEGIGSGIGWTLGGPLGIAGDLGVGLALGGAGKFLGDAVSPALPAGVGSSQQMPSPHLQPSMKKTMIPAAQAMNHQVF